MLAAADDLRFEEAARIRDELKELKADLDAMPRLAGDADAAVMEVPRRPGAVHGEEYRLPHAKKVVQTVRVGDEIPPAPSYG